MFRGLKVAGSGSCLPGADTKELVFPGWSRDGPGRHSGLGALTGSCLTVLEDCFYWALLLWLSPWGLQALSSRRVESGEGGVLETMEAREEKERRVGKGRVRKEEEGAEGKEEKRQSQDRSKVRGRGKKERATEGRQEWMAGRALS